MSEPLVGQRKRPWFLERWNDALWSWAMRREHLRVARFAYLAGKVIDR